MKAAHHSVPTAVEIEGLKLSIGCCYFSLTIGTYPPAMILLYHGRSFCVLERSKKNAMPCFLGIGT